MKVKDFNRKVQAFINKELDCRLKEYIHFVNQDGLQKTIEQQQEKIRILKEQVQMLRAQLHLHK